MKPVITVRRSDGSEKKYLKSELTALMLHDSRGEDRVRWYGLMSDSPTMPSPEVVEHEEKESVERIRALGPVAGLLHAVSHLVMLPAMEEVLSLVYGAVESREGDAAATEMVVEMAPYMEAVVHNTVLGSMLSATTLLRDMGVYTLGDFEDVTLDQRLHLDIEDWIEATEED